MKDFILACQPIFQQTQVFSCETINKYFFFEKKPLSEEEEKYPLAFGFVMYKDLVQVRYCTFSVRTLIHTFLRIFFAVFPFHHFYSPNKFQVLLEFSIFYHPQNAYCITIDGTASRPFKNVIMALPKCFKNVASFVSMEEFQTFHYRRGQIQMMVCR